MEISIQNQSGVYLVTMLVVCRVGIFSRRLYRDLFLDSVRFCQQNKAMDVFGYVIMADHVHMIIQSREGRLSDLLRDFKKFTSKKLVGAIVETLDLRSDWMLKRFEFACKRHSRNEKFQFWEHGSNPIEILSPDDMWKSLEFVHQNPVRNGLVKHAKDFLYSSAGDFHNENGLIPIVFT